MILLGLQIVLWALLALLLGIVAWYRYWDFAVIAFGATVEALNSDLPKWVWTATKVALCGSFLAVNVAFFFAVFWTEVGPLSAVLFLALIGLLTLYRPRLLRQTPVNICPHDFTDWDDCPVCRH